MREFWVDNLDHVFFFYGLAFFAAGLMIVARRRDMLQRGITKTFGWLAAFALVHGANEWVDMWRIVRGIPPSTGPRAAPSDRLIHPPLRVRPPRLGPLQPREMGGRMDDLGPVRGVPRAHGGGRRARDLAAVSAGSPWRPAGRGRICLYLRENLDVRVSP